MPITIDFKGKLVLITGGGRGIGLAIATALAKGGADVAISYTSRDASSIAADLSKSYGVTVRAYRCEVTRSTDVNSMIGDVEKDYGKKVDIGVANAGGPILGPFSKLDLTFPGMTLWKDAHEVKDDDFKSIFEINTFGAFYLARALFRSWLSLPIDVGAPSTTLDVQGMKGINLNKQILFVSSISSMLAMTPQRQAAYNASKGAMTMLSKSLALEWSHLGIYVNSVSPGYVKTEMISDPPSDEAKAWVGEWERRTPVGRQVSLILLPFLSVPFASPEEIGDFIALMLSDKQGGMGFMAGSDVIVDGDQLMHLDCEVSYDQLGLESEVDPAITEAPAVTGRRLRLSSTHPTTHPHHRLSL
ncbi:MAG: hypothetical protein TREMPRED_002602 [Tremellales sp. Tagirdzhanova-0007]|nr:MAG: hypothetical protein TREMPRED_002602 [Tremellales sp. Tagirdzhanova-0007]